MPQCKNTGLLLLFMQISILCTNQSISFIDRWIKLLKWIEKVEFQYRSFFLKPDVHIDSRKIRPWDLYLLTSSLVVIIMFQLKITASNSMAQKREKMQPCQHKPAHTDLETDVTEVKKVKRSRRLYRFSLQRFEVSQLYLNVISHDKSIPSLSLQQLNSLL